MLLNIFGFVLYLFFSVHVFGAKVFGQTNKLGIFREILIIKLVWTFSQTLHLIYAKTDSLDIDKLIKDDQIVSCWFFIHLETLGWW